MYVHKVHMRNLVDRKSIKMMWMWIIPCYFGFFHVISKRVYAEKGWFGINGFTLIESFLRVIGGK